MRIKLIHITCLEQEEFALFVLLHCTACAILVPGHSNESTKSWPLGYLSIPRICYYYSACSVTQPCLTLSNPMDYSPSLSKWESIGLLCPWDSPGKNTGVGCHALLQGIFPTQGSNPHLLCLLLWQQVLYHSHHLGSLHYFMHGTRNQTSSLLLAFVCVLVYS